MDHTNVRVKTDFNSNLTEFPAQLMLCRVDGNCEDKEHLPTAG
jgi:hypothetical protein